MALLEVKVPVGLTDWIGTGGATGIIAAVLYAILRGHLVPRRVVEDMRSDKDKQIAELGQVIDLWRSAALAKDEALREFIPMLTEITENDKVILKLLGALRAAADRRSEETL
jgi:hypothetical protein